MSRTTPQTPSNALVVQTTTGFTQGDLVYYKGATNDYVPTGSLTATGTVNFDITDLGGLYSAQTGGMVSPVFATASANIGGTRNNFAAKLTNGNIVQVYVPLVSGYPAFRIVDTSGTQVVAETAVTGSFAASNNNCGVLALTGGGFVVYWLNTSGGVGNYYPTYAIYTNTGTVTTAAQQDSSSGTVSSDTGAIRGVALANGGFGIAFSDNTTPFIWVRAYGATGTGTYTVQNAAQTFTGTSYAFGLTARSDSTICLVFKSTTTTVVRYQIYNATTGAKIVNTSFPVTGSGYPTSATTLADGTTIVLGYLTGSGSLTPAYRLLPSGNTLGAEVLIPVANIVGGNNYTWMTLLGLSSGGFIYLFADQTTQIRYVVYNSSGTVLSGTNASGALPKQIPAASIQTYGVLTAVEVGSNVNLYWSNISNQVQPINMYFAQVSTSTYNPVLVSSVSTVVGTPSGTAGAIATSTATPTKAYVYSANTETLTSVTAFTTSATAPASTIITATTCDQLSSTTLPNGNILIAYRNASTYVVSVSIYTSAMVLLQTIAVGTSLNNAYSVRIAAFSSGKFVVAFPTGSTTITMYLYSSSYTFVSSYVIPYAVMTGVSNYIALASLSNDRVVICFQQSSLQGEFGSVILDSSLSPITSYSGYLSGGGTLYNVSVAGDSSGGFMMSCHDTSSSGLFSWIRNNAGSYTTFVSNNSFTNSNNAINRPMVFTQGGVFTVFGNSGSAIVLYSIGQNSYGGSTFGSGSVNSSQGMGASGSGNILLATVTSSSGVTIYSVPSNAYSGNIIASSTLTGYSFKYSGDYSFISITAGVGDKVVASWLDTNGYPVYALWNTRSVQSTVNVTAGVTLNNTPLPIVPNATTTVTPTIQNSVFVGVAGTTATAGGTGTILTNGLTQLNTNYPASTPSQNFDHQSPNGSGVAGVKGSIVNRIVNLQGAA